MPKGILITGCPHTATTLAFDMLLKHREVCAPPRHCLNENREFNLDLFVQFLLKTELESDGFYFNAREFHESMNAYVRLCGNVGGRHVLYKMPDYPLNYLHAFKAYFSDGMQLCFTTREKQRVLASHTHRGKPPLSGPGLRANLARLSPNIRVELAKAYLAPAQSSDRGRRIVSALYDFCEERRERWDSSSEPKFVTLNMRRFSTQEGYVRKRLALLGLACGEALVREMLSSTVTGRV